MALDEPALSPAARDLAQMVRHGWARTHAAAPDGVLSGLRTRADAMIAGDAPRDGLFFQHDSPTGAYEDLRFGDGWVGPSPAYRKIEGLERDPVFAEWIFGPVTRGFAQAAIDGPVAIARTVLWTKAGVDQGGGTELPWHQDGGLFWGLSGQPTLQIWLALDDTPVESGCVEVIADSHLGGLATPEGGTIPGELTAPRAADVLPLPARAGEVLLLHNLVWHRSGRNRTRRVRRALSICLMSASITCTRKRRAPRRFERLY
ncbi:MAG TPA: phytanoyl-CoA dioxygenase family protein [Kofleriaceae bacterium]|nr:phytanoyl-CoA dioxygenase family protein [Kofleriaceae bacterium]